MMKYFLTLVVSLASFFAVGQQMSYQQWKEEAKTQINLQPEYGNVQKTQHQLTADKIFIDQELITDTTHRKASEHLVRIGFDYLYRGDLQTAMRRFNQAWLLDPTNENAYWGYAVIYFNFNDLAEAMRLLDKGLKINPNSSNILTDEATIHMSYYMSNGSKEEMNKALSLFLRSYKITPTNQNTLFKLSALYFYKKDCANARLYYDACMKLGGKPIPQNYSDDLNRMCNK